MWEEREILGTYLTYPQILYHPSGSPPQIPFLPKPLLLLLRNPQPQLL